jgi:hypothetical protein
VAAGYVSYLPPDESPLTQVALPSSEAIRAMPDLDAMGANAMNLFPDYGKLAEAVTIRLQLEASSRSSASRG